MVLGTRELKRWLWMYILHGTIATYKDEFILIMKLKLITCLEEPLSDQW